MKPGNVQLGGKDFSVRESARPLKDCYGYCRAGEIVLSKGLKPHEQKLYFFHEAIHALFWYLDEEIVEAASRELVDAIEILDLE